MNYAQYFQHFERLAMSTFRDPQDVEAARQYRREMEDNEDIQDAFAKLRLVVNSEKKRVAAGLPDPLEVTDGEGEID